MGLTIYYRSLRTLSQQERDAVARSATRLCQQHTWLSCEPVWFFDEESDEHLMGGSKPNFMPHPEDVASAQAQGLPDGTVRDLIDILCHLSREHAVDWELTDDFEILGLIQNGVPDRLLMDQIDEFANLGKLFRQTPPNNANQHVDEWDDDGPDILPFRRPND